MPNTDPTAPRHRVRAMLAGIALALLAAVPASAVTPEELTGDYRLTAIMIDYKKVSPPPLDAGDFARLDGYLAATGSVLVFNWFGIAAGFEYEREEQGRYAISGSRIVLTDAEGQTTALEIAMPDTDTVVLTGQDYDEFQRLDFDFTYEFTREATYYNQAQLDAAVAAATDGLYTQAELDAAVQAALDAFEPKVIHQPIVIPLMD